MMTYWTIFGSLVVCAIGCLIAALLGRWTRSSHLPRFLRSAVAAVLLAWINLGGLHGGIGPLPATLILFLSPKILSDPRPEAVGYLMIGFSFFSIAMVFLAYWICSKPKTLGQSP